MTTYTITETERIFLIEHAKDVRQLAMLESLQPNTQEPSAWITPDGEGFRLRFSVPNQDVPLGWDALYTRPAPQQKPLTDEQIIEIAQLAQSAEPGREGYVLRISFARAIEAALGVKP